MVKSIDKVCVIVVYSALKWIKVEFLMIKLAEVPDGQIREFCTISV
jgi:hypothetical protein